MIKLPTQSKSIAAIHTDESRIPNPPFSTMISSAVSSPGKVLLAGGYLVLDPEYSGLVFALSARIHVLSSPLKGHPEGTIYVVSPQFENSHWSYQVSKSIDGSGVVVAQVEHEGSSENPFVETTIRYCLNYLSITQPDLPFLVPSVKLTILADNDYYSQPKSSTPLPPFNKLPVPIFKANKTGLGSSAALVTSLTACILSTYANTGPVDVTQPEHQKLVHNLAQASHCAAQGKVGSGFDVAAAVFGSCVYHRFSPSILEPLQDTEVATKDPNQFAKTLTKIVQSEWDYTVSKTRIPTGLRIVMGDVDCGSSTPGMVRHVLAWRKEKAEDAKALWDTLEKRNLGLINLFADLKRKADENPEEYGAALDELRNTIGDNASAQEPENQTVKLFHKLKSDILSIRELIRKMGDATNVPIEPPSQTALLDYLGKNCKGVIGGVVPGAGGYDAVALLIADDESVVDGIKEKLVGYKFGKEEGLEGGQVEIMGTREEHEGLKTSTAEIRSEYL